MSSVTCSRRDDGRELVERVDGVALAQHERLGAVVGVAHRDAHHEAVALRLGQGVGALHLERVLRRDDEERLGQRVRVPVDGDLALLHRLEQRGLRLGGGAVDLVGDHDVREDRAAA